MSHLDYQNADNHLRERRDALRRSWFGVSRSDAFLAFAEDVGGEVVPGRIRSAVAVNVLAENTIVTLDTHAESHGDSEATYTRFRTANPRSDAFHFSLHRAGHFTRFARRIGLLRDVYLGDDAFYQSSILKTREAHVPIARAVFSDPAYRVRFRNLPVDWDFGITIDVPWFRRLCAEPAGQLRLLTLGVKKDVDRLKSMFGLFVDSIRRVRDAYP